MLRLGPAVKPVGGAWIVIEAAAHAMRKVPFATLQEVKGNAEVLRKIEGAGALPRSLRAALS